MPEAVPGAVSAIETGIRSIHMKAFFLSNYFFLRLITSKLADSCRAGRFCDVIMTAEKLSRYSGGMFDGSCACDDGDGGTAVAESGTAGQPLTCLPS